MYSLINPVCCARYNDRKLSVLIERCVSRTHLCDVVF